MKRKMLENIVYYIKQIDEGKMSIQDFRKEFESCLDEAFEGYIHPYAREEFKKIFFKGEI